MQSAYTAAPSGAQQRPTSPRHVPELVGCHILLHGPVNNGLGHGLLARQILRFSLVGVAGFLVDAGVLTLALRFLGWNLYSARVLSFLTAVTATWIMNRRFTFGAGASASLFGEWVRFTASNAVGGLVNFGTYVWLINSLAAAHDFPVIAVAAGSLSGLMVNFSLSKIFVFRESRPAP